MSHAFQALTCVQRYNNYFTLTTIKLDISILITGRSLHQAKAHAEEIKAKLTPHGLECLTPFDVCPEPERAH